MPLILTTPGGIIDPLQQIRKVGVYIKLSDLHVKPNLESEDFIRQMILCLKWEFEDCMDDWREGKPIQIVRHIEEPETIQKGK